MTITKHIFLGILCSLFFFNTQAQTADEIIAQYLEATGGIENWKKLDTRLIKMKSILADGEVPITIMEKSPNKRKIVMEYGGKEIVEIYDGTNAWNINPFQGIEEPKKIEGEAKEKIANEAIFENGFIDYQRKGHKATLEGKEVIHGKECFKIKFEHKTKGLSYYFFEVQSGLLFMNQKKIEAGELAGKFSETYYDEYSKVGDLLLYYELITFIGGEAKQHLKVDEIKLNTEIENSEFAFEK